MGVKVPSARPSTVQYGYQRAENGRAAQAEGTYGTAQYMDSQTGRT